jgi:hypothetical protein
MKSIVGLYGSYLSATYPAESGNALASALMESGLSIEATLLLAHLAAKDSLLFPNPWTTKPIALGLTPPQNPRLGDCWFDPIELVTCVFVPATKDWDPRAGGWFSTHPVQRWQYLGFILALKYEQKVPSRFPLFELQENVIDNDLAPVTGMYAYAAKIYCNWFGKSLVGGNMQVVIAQMLENEVQQIMPPNLNLWASEFAFGREDQPMAYNLETAASEDGFELLEMEFPPEKKLVYDEWERSPWVGFGTYIPTTGFGFAQDGEIWPFVKLLNMARR